MRASIQSWLLVLFVCTGFTVLGQAQETATIESPVLRVTLQPKDASVTVTDKRSGFVWRQQVRDGFRVIDNSLKTSANSISGKVTGDGATYLIAISINENVPDGFDLTLDIPGKRYVPLPNYPFLFQTPKAGWYYVQNTSGEGLLMPLDKPAEMRKAFSWSGSQPWWGLTNLKQAMAARLDSFCNPDGRPTPDNRAAYAVPLRIHYSFHDTGGYVGLAKEYRAFFLQTHPDLKPLRERESKRPALSNLRDGVYTYVWGKDPAEDLDLVQEMKSAGIDHGVAVFYGRRDVDRQLFEGIEKLGWTAGMYRMPTANLFRISRDRSWVNAVLTGRRSATELYRESNPRVWDRVCAAYILPSWLGKAREAIQKLGLQLFYFDTLVAQIAPCLDPAHPSTIEQNQQARLELMSRTRDLGVIIGSGEGRSPTWALPGLDYFEGQMSLGTYGGMRLHIPAGDYEKDVGESYKSEAALSLDETRRIPLYQLAFHDYVAGTWNWRDSNFVSSAFVRKKDLFNILYGTMPMWHVSRSLWAKHKDQFISSYRAIASVRARIGWAEMVNHGWLTPDRSVQFTDWSSGDRVIVNFGNSTFDPAGGKPLPGNSFRVERVSASKVTGLSRERQVRQMALR